MLLYFYRTYRNIDLSNYVRFINQRDISFVVYVVQQRFHRQIPNSLRNVVDWVPERIFDPLRCIFVVIESRSYSIFTFKVLFKYLFGYLISILEYVDIPGVEPPLFTIEYNNLNLQIRGIAFFVHSIVL